MALEDIAGYSLRRGLGSGSVGTVWLLRDLASGRHAVLKRVPKTSIPSVETFTADIALARSINHPHVARLLEVRESDGEWLLFSQYVAAGTLAALLERRGPLSLGELVTLISPLAQGLAAMHRVGLVHGHLDLRDVMFDADGRPVITDAGLRLQEYPGSPLADLSALATIAHQAGGSPADFPDTLFTGDGDQLSRRVLHLAPPLPIDLGQTSPPTPHQPALTPSASQTPTHHASADRASSRASTDLAHDAPAPSDRAPTDHATPDRASTTHASTVPASTEPASNRVLLRRPPGARRAGRLAAGKRSTRRRSTPSQRSTGRAGQRRLAYGVLVVSGLVAVGALVVGLVGVLGKPATGSTVVANEASPSKTPTPKQPTEPKPSTSPGGERVSQDRHAWLRTLQGLDTRRARAFSTWDRTELDKIYVPGSAPWTADRSLLASHQQQRIRVDGLRVQIENLVIEQPGNDTVVLRIVDRLVAGAAITSTGQRTPLPRSAPTARRITLKAGNATWRISAITAA